MKCQSAIHETDFSEMPISDPRDGFFYPILMIDSYIPYSQVESMSLSSRTCLSGDKIQAINRIVRKTAAA